MFTKGMQHVDKLNTSLKGESECFPAYVVALCEKHKIHSWHASRIERTLRKYCMGKLYSELTDKQIDFIEQQKIFFVGTAAETGTVNISPKGGDSLRVLDENTIAWLNHTGSGNESAAHVLRNPRMTIMFCAFEGEPLILRAYGQARVVHASDGAWSSLLDLFPPSVAARQVYVLDIEKVQSSCGMSVPYYDYQGDRQELNNWFERTGEAGIKDYWVKKNQQSIDGFDTEIVERAGLQSPKE